MNFIMSLASVALPPSSPLRAGLRGVALAASLAAASTGCGQKGPLTMPPPASAASAPAAAK